MLLRGGDGAVPTKQGQVSDPESLGKAQVFVNEAHECWIRYFISTLEELPEVITWAQLGIHDKPVGELNVDGYYNSLLSFMDKAIDEGFIAPSACHIIVSAPTAHELLSKLEEYVPNHHGAAPRLRWETEQQLGY
ncbi:hypothetical protein MLD38_024811 [Melastoma candidum]|uniref:Uncharacterized protein n=1 Tax=Melastoma candidum TaxID=119954 RepID=A0ACB9NV65_9MYRT|nr:hypothetical protein MLD38_024811 [Melastoma candidum]